MREQGAMTTFKTTMEPRIGRGHVGRTAKKVAKERWGTTKTGAGLDAKSTVAPHDDAASGTQAC